MDTRAWFARATTGFEAVLDGLEDADLSGPGLGDWDLRSLLGHTTRAWRTIGTYLTDEPTAVVLDSPEAYYRAAAESLADPAQVARRGVEAGIALGDRPLSAAREIAARGAELVRSTGDRAVLDTPLGGIVLADYLPTRAFEVTVHSLDLVRAANLDVPEDLSAAAVPALSLAASLARPAVAVEAVMALTGRPGWSGTSVL